MENDDEQITTSDLVEKMREFSNQDTDAYSVKHMKSKLDEHFGNNIVITSINGKADVTFRSTASNILRSFYEAPKLTDPEAEKKRIVKAAADLIKNDIKCRQTSKDFYPTPSDISSLEKNSAFVPETLRVLLGTIFSEKKTEMKIASIGQTIVQAARPRVLIAPLQIGLAVQMHHHYGSKFIVDSLNRHGFCSSYSDVKRFEMCAAKTQGTEIPGFTPGHFVQYVADNADHNIRTLDGQDTFHGMGIIAAVTPGTKRQIPVPRCSARATDVADVGKIAVHFYKGTCGASLSLVYKKIQVLQQYDPTWKLDLLCNVVWPIRSPRPGWSGIMQAVSQGTHPGKSSVTFLPAIDMNASDMSCVYSTLRFVVTECRRHQVEPVLTFDQPLWWKAQLIVSNEPHDSDLRSLILRLGRFHTEMSYLGCIGAVMSSTGLKELLEVVYAQNTVGHMLSGKALARAVRGHFLVDAVLNAIVTAQAFDISLPDVHLARSTDQTTVDANELEEAQTEGQTGVKQSDAIPKDLQETIKLYDTLIAGDVSAEAVCSEHLLERVQESLEQQKMAMAKHPTARLWLQYMEMVRLLRQFIKAERTGNWCLHLQSLQQMLPYFAAAGNNLYTKCVHIYLQQMLQLQTQHPTVYDFFNTGHHVIRRSDRYWAGLSSDLVIEQVLMRSMKTTGGLTRDRGMAESQRTQWLLSMPACADVNGAMQDLTDANYLTSDQHKDVTEARKVRDDKDNLVLLGFLQDRNPFVLDPSLRNIATGVTADVTVNAHNAEEVGKNILKSMEGGNALEYTFKKKNQVITMGHRTSAKVDGKSIQVDPQLLFQRLLTVAGKGTDNLQETFKYELCSNPSSLFDSNGLLREANKPLLADAIWTIGRGPEMPAPTDDGMCYVLDGGSLIQRLPWKRDATFDCICQSYVDYIQRKYNSPIIVFDGYDSGPSTKDTIHLRRTKGIVGAKVNFVGGMPLKTKKEHFLTNSTNKQKFILMAYMLSDKLHGNGIKSIHADGDADLLIAQTAVHSATKQPTTVIGEDTDLLVLLCFHSNPDSFGLFFRSEGRKTTKTLRVWNINFLRNTLGPEMCHLLPFAHAVAGCDTTSRLFGIGKGTVLRKLSEDTHFKEQGEIFSSEASKSDIFLAGEKALSSLHSGNRDEGLNELRYRRFCEKMSKSITSVQVHSLPPARAATRYHSARVYYQVQQWMGKSDNLDPQEWGWLLVQDRLEPRTTDLSPAPEDLLKVIRCNCKNDCDTRRCTCKKHGLECSSACGECRGFSCTNSSLPSTDDIGDELDSDSVSRDD